MRYVLFPLVDEACWSSQPKAEMGEKVAAFMWYQEALKEAGVFVGAYGPEPSSAAKLGARNRAEAIHIARENGWL